MQAGVDFVTVRGPQNVWKVYLVWMTCWFDGLMVG